MRRVGIWSVCLTFLMCFCLACPAHGKGPESDKVLIYINLWQKRLHVLNEQGKVIASFRVAAGARDTPSPVGSFLVSYKAKEWGGGFGSRWLGLNVPWGIYGIHGTNRPESVGRFVSHGCFRMRNQDIEKLYELIPLKTQVLIDGPIMGHEQITYRILVPGSRGALVQLVQNHLKAGDYYTGKIHGIFDSRMERAVIRFQKQNGLEVSGQIQLSDLIYLGIIE